MMPKTRAEGPMVKLVFASTVKCSASGWANTWLVREEEARLLATACQLNNQDQPVPYLPPLVAFCGVGTGTFRSDVGNWLFFFAHLESRQAAIAAGIQTRLELHEGGQIRALEIPYGILVRLATECHKFLSELLENWHHNALNQLRLFAANEEVEKERRDSSSRSRQRSGSLVRGNVLDIDLMDLAAASASASASASCLNARQKWQHHSWCLS